MSPGEGTPNRSRAWWEQHEMLWKELVPPRGPSDSLQGELIRLTGKLSDEASRNGNINFGDRHVQAWEFVATTLVESGAFTEQQIVEIRGAVSSIVSAPLSVPADGPGNPYSLLAERAVDFCLAEPDSIPLHGLSGEAGSLL